MRGGGIVEENSYFIWMLESSYENKLFSSKLPVFNPTKGSFRPLVTVRCLLEDWMYFLPCGMIIFGLVASHDNIHINSPYAMMLM